MKAWTAVAAVGRSCDGGGVLVQVNARRLVVALTLALSALFDLSCRQIVGIKARPNPLCSNELLIDSLEDGDDEICNVAMRRGVWSTFGDGSHTAFSPPAELFTPTPTSLSVAGGRAGSRYAARFKGAAFTKWGGGMGLVLNGPGLSAGQPYDASRTAGIKFWMKANVPVSVTFRIPETTLPVLGGECDDSAGTYNCDHHFAFRIAAPNANDWVEYQVPYEVLQQPYSKTAANGDEIFGSATLNRSRLVGIDFVVDPGAPFDVWIDDVSFFRCAPGACAPTCNSGAAPLMLCPADDDLTAVCRPVGIACADPLSTCDPLMIDNLEDGDTRLCIADGRRGYWFTAADPATTYEPVDFTPTMIPEGRGASLYAAHFSGTTSLGGWGALMGVDLKVQGRTSLPYDLRPSGAIKFWMKSNAPVAVAFRMPETTMVKWGGTCVGDFDNGCDDHFEFEVVPPNPDDWVEYTVPFDALSRMGSGGSATWDSSRVVGLQFRVPGGRAFDVWVDDVRLVDCPSPGSCLPDCTDPAAPVACPTDADYPARCVSVAFGCSGSVSDLFDVWGGGSQDVWVTGEKGTVAHWDGSAWSALVETATTEILQSVWGSGPRDVWAVGGNGTIVHWNGAFWEPYASGTTNRLESVWGTGPRDVWAIGEQGTIVHWNGFAWSTFPSGTTEFFIGNVWGSGPADVWAVGEVGIIAHWDGTAWSPSKVDGFNVLFGVWGSGPNDVWAVGGDGRKGAGIVHWNGTAWTATMAGTTEPLFGVWGSGSNDVWAVGAAGTIVHWNGSAWSASASGTTEQLFDVWGSGPNDVWVVGRQGTLLHWDGSVWSRRSIPRN